MAQKTFSAQVDEMIATNERRLTAVMRQSLQDVINEAQTPVAKGGKMRVDTGFLRASGQISYNGMPSGPSRGASDAPGSYNYNEATTTAELGKLSIGQTLYFGWTAAYARYRELYDGFLESALQKWPQIVAKNTDELRRRMK